MASQVKDWDVGAKIAELKKLADGGSSPIVFKIEKAKQPRRRSSRAHMSSAGV